jgi:hypothetical protein
LLIQQGGATPFDPRRTHNNTRARAYGFYLAASALMPGLHLRHIDPEPGAPRSPRSLSSLRPRAKTIIEGGRHDGDND